MKKFLRLLFVAGMFALASCGGSETKTDTTQDSLAAANKADSLLQMSAADTVQAAPPDSTVH